MVTPDEAINKAYAELLEAETKQKKPKALPMFRDRIYCCVCEHDVTSQDHLQGLTDEEYIEAMDTDQYCGRSPRCCP